MYPLRPGIKINQIVVHFSVAICVILYHWNWRGSVVLFIFSSCEFKWLVLVPPCFIVIKRLLSLLLHPARFIPWKLNKTIKQKMLIRIASCMSKLKTLRFRVTNLNPLPQQEISTMGSFTTNMYYHIALQAERTTIYLTVKESCMHISRQGKTKLLEKTSKTHIPWKRPKISAKAGRHTWCIFTYVTLWNSARICKSYSHVPTS